MTDTKHDGNEKLDLFKVTLDWAAEDSDQGRHIASVWAMNSEDAIRAAAEEMARIEERVVRFENAAARAEYIDTLVRDAGIAAVMRVRDTIADDLIELLKDDPASLAQIQVILSGPPAETAKPTEAATQGAGGKHGYLDISTGHIPPSSREFLDTVSGSNLIGQTVASYEFGCFVSVPPSPEYNDSMPADVRTVLDFARARGCEIVRFDAAGDTFDELPFYDDEETEQSHPVSPRN